MSTVISTIQELLDANLIIQSGIGRSTGGRRPTFYSVNPQGGYFVGIDFNAEAIHASLINLNNNVIQSYSEVMTQTASSIVLRLIEITKFLTATLEDSSLLTGIGIGAPGLVDSKTGKLIYYAHIKDFSDIDIKTPFNEAFSVPVFVDNNINMLALAYKELPENARLDNFIIIAIRTGVGMSCMLENRVYRGFSNTAGEIGHVRVYPSQTVCECGQVGCLEAEASNKALLRKINASPEYDYLSQYGSQPSPNHTIRELVCSILSGNPKSMSLLRETCDYLSSAIVQLVNILNPQSIILTGELTECGDIMLDIIKEKVLKESFLYNAEKLEMNIWRCNPNATAFGASIFAKSTIFAPHDIAEMVFSADDSNN